MKRKTIVKQGRRVAMAACGLLIGAWAMQSCSDDVLTGQPSWLGNSIYERLQEEGNYTTTLRLIDDLELREVLGHTGSKTLFVADDEAYQKWFAGNAWGVRSYEQLSAAQKKLLLNNSMINNAYLIELMSNVSGTPPVEGKAMRRETATSIYDSVYVMPVSEMPTTEAWEALRTRGKAVPIFKDGTSAPMIHFLPAYMSSNKITSEDLAILTNGQATSANEAWVNGKKVVDRDITCKNGYVQKVDGVIEILRQHPVMSMWSHLVDRFSAPYYHATGTREYNRIYNNEDSVFTLRYFSKRSLGGEANSTLPNGRIAKGLLSFDPGWNHYMYSNTMGYDLHYDAGAMIVPTNEALDRWWNNEGKDLQDEYHSWDSIPENTLAKLINVNMLDVFSSSVPSKFNTVLNDAKDQLGITMADVDSCFMGCNGVVYLVNRVFAPAEYSSVAYPALAHESTMNVIYWAIDQLNFLPYLLSMDSQYALLLPNNDAMYYYLDPAHYGESQSDGTETAHLITFRYDTSKSNALRIQASRYQVTLDEDGNITNIGMRLQEQVDPDYTNNVIKTMLNELMDQLIIVIPDKTKNLEKYVDEGYTLFKTKGGSLLRITKNADGKLAFEGGWQMEHNHRQLASHEEFQKTNGRSYLLTDQMPMGSTKTLYLTMKEHPEYQGFLSLLENDYSDMLSVKLNGKYESGNSRKGSKNLRLFDNYNYTVFIPSTESVNRLQQQKILPTTRELTEFDGDTNLLDSICLAEHWYVSSDTQDHKDSIQKDVKQCLKSIVGDFVRYHVMDRSIAIGMAPEKGMEGEASYESMKRNPETGRFFPITASYDQNRITVKDVKGNTRTVTTREGLYNNICREYWFQKDDKVNYSDHLFMASSVVAHLIDEPIYYEDMKPWRQVVEEYLKNN